MCPQRLRDSPEEWTEPNVQGYRTVTLVPHSVYPLRFGYASNWPDHVHPDRFYTIRVSSGS